ncbi:hypothetical protein MTO96_038231 [Rhipicephalus appendiculatus]
MESTSLALGYSSVAGVLYVPPTDYPEKLVRRAFASDDDPYVRLRKNSPESGRRRAIELVTSGLLQRHHSAALQRAIDPSVQSAAADSTA